MLTKIIRDGEGDEHAQPFKVEAFKDGRTVITSERETTDGSGLVGNAEAAEREAYELGFKAGERAGFVVGTQKTAITCAAIVRLLDEMTVIRDELYKSAEVELTALAMTIAKKVIGRELETSNEVVLSAVKAAACALSGGRELNIKINPKDMETLKEHKAEILEYGMGKGVRLRSDDGIARGGCTVETSFQEADATIEGCLLAIEERLKR
ncbi:MAG: hypothetical protein A3J24_01815 [Deltaproteobacteria bacterium RIFCSPLOWO2_02_FULL_53_8]|nr:MAG: hypothetical protein A3J24_01815 [Deltaproteobacteria bacterium RIFCSPLOWO2_02_FULL_53_8]